MGDKDENQKNKSIMNKISRIAIGSCNCQDLKQPLWPIISSRNISAFVWAGDAIYADTLKKGGRKCGTPESIQQTYEKQLSNRNYQTYMKHIQKNNVTVFGTIDDHDFGCNNGDKNYQYKKDSAKAFIQFTKEPMDSPIYERAMKGLGVYGVKVFDFDRTNGNTKANSNDDNDNDHSVYLVPDHEAGLDPDLKYQSNYDDSHNNVNSYSKKSVAVFVLDVRTHKTPWGIGWDRIKPDYNGDFLGEAQWQWFQTALSRSKASVNIIVQGLQIHPSRHPDQEVSESWDKFPLAQQRLYHTILESGAKAPFLISGDVHMSQLMRKNCYKHVDVKTNTIPSSFSMSNMSSSIPLEHNYDRFLMELTSSGMTHSWGTFLSPEKMFHESWYYPWISFVCRSLMSFFHVIIPMPDLVTTTTISNKQKKQHKSKVEEEEEVSWLELEYGGAENAKLGKQFSLELNFAELEFDWDNEMLIARVLGKNMSAPPLMSARWSFDRLSGHKMEQQYVDHHSHVGHLYDYDVDSLWKEKTRLLQQHYNNYKTHNSSLTDDSHFEWTCIPVGGIPKWYYVTISHIVGSIVALCLMVLPLIILFVLYKVVVSSPRKNAKNKSLFHEKKD